MKITIDETKLADELNRRIDIPYAMEAVEEKLFRMGVEAAAKALVDVSKGVSSLGEFGVTVE